MKFTEWIDLSGDESLVRLAKRDENVHGFVQFHEVLWIFTPFAVCFFGVFEWGAARIGFGPGTFENITRIFIAEFYANKEVIVNSARNVKIRKSEIFTSNRRDS